MEQKEDLMKIAEESMKFLQDAINHDWSAYPVSSLPYQKEEIKKAIRYYLDSQGKKLSSVGVALAKSQYSVLAEFIDDNDAALANAVGKRVGVMRFEGNVKTIDLPESLKGTDYRKRFFEISKKISDEKSILFNDIQRF